MNSIFLMPGPMHLFWTTGVFWLFELSKKGNLVIFIYDERYLNDEKFNKIKELPFVLEVIFFDYSRNKFLKHYNLKQKISERLKFYNPNEVWMNHQSYVENQYLLHLSGNLKETKIIIYQNGRESLNIKNDFNAIQQNEIDNFLVKYHLNKGMHSIVNYLFKYKYLYLFIMEYYLLPFIFLGDIFYPVMNVYTGEYYKNNIEKWNKNKCYWFGYLEREIYEYNKINISKLQKVNHPLLTTLEYVYNYLYKIDKNKNQILILPSYGFTNLLLKNKNKNDVIFLVFKGWYETILVLKQYYIGFAIYIKLHPASFSDPIWEKIISLLFAEFEDLNIISPKESAEFHIIESKVIVGDVSSTLWWAGFLQEKIVISMDIFGYPGGDEMKEYSDELGINYFTSANSLSIYLENIK